MSVILKIAGLLMDIYFQMVDVFISMVAKIKSLNPVYKQPGDGSNGECDCIGLEIGALRRMGIKWVGIHGSNYAARYATYNLEYIEEVSALKKGDIVYKATDEKGIVKLACNAGTKKQKWKLPDRYKKGNAYYNGDMKDYYHVGIVTKVDPLNITHMTSPRMKVDTSLSGGWNYHGQAKPLVDAAENKAKTETATPAPVPTEPVPSTGSEAIVVADNGKPVKMRQYPSTDCRTWENIPCGTKATIVEPGEEWAKINCGRRRGWYMMAKYLDVVGDGKGKY